MCNSCDLIVCNPTIEFTKEAVGAKFDKSQCWLVTEFPRCQFGR